MIDPTRYPTETSAEHARAVLARVNGHAAPDPIPDAIALLTRSGYRVSKARAAAANVTKVSKTGRQHGRCAEQMRGES